MKRGPKPKVTFTPSSLPEPPEHLSDVERQEFNRVARVLSDAGLINEVDADAIALYAKWYGTWRTANAHVEEYGQVMTTRSGVVKPNPSVGIASTASREMLKCLNALGMTPTSRKGVERSALRVVDPMEELLGLG